MTIPQIKVFLDPAAVAHEAADRLVFLAAQAIAARGQFSLVLSGGNTPRALYELLAGEDFRDQIQWPKVEVFFSDERCVPPNHPQSNYGMARNSLLGHVPIPGDNIYRMRGEINPEEAASEYGKLLKERFAEGGPDLLLLGMGEDGHTASLFPETDALKESKHRCVSTYVPRLKTWRITLTPPFLNRAGSVIVMVTGAGKAARVQQALEGAVEPERLPIQFISPTFGTMTWLLDAAAAGMEENKATM